MRNWMLGLLAILSGLLGAGVLYLVAAPPRGEPITLHPPPTPAPMVVYVTGAVAAPGVYALPQGSRVQDALQAAGGPLPEASLAGLNLAARLEDGAQITLAAIPSPTGPENTRPNTNPPAPSSAVSNPASPTDLALININTATQAELESLPRSGPATAQKIIAYREANGPFTAIEDIQNVSGIGPATFEQIKTLISVGQ